MLLYRSVISNLSVFSLSLLAAWIASKVKAVAPVLPSGGATTSIPSAENQPLNPGGGGAMEVPAGNQPTTKRRKNNGKKIRTTKVPVVFGSTTIATAVVEAAGANNNDDADDKDDSPTGDEPTKKAIRRAIRAILSRP